ncbi:hypothetical protein QTP88_016377 [Uroleucon formosanum]
MEKNLEQRIAIKCCVKLEKSATETFQMMIKAYGELVMSRATVFRWHSQFSSGRESFDDEQRCGRPSTTKTDENIARVSAVLNEHRNVGCRLVEELTGIPKMVVQRIIREDLGKRKLCARFVPHALTTEQRQRRVSHAKDVLQMVTNTPNFLKNIITGDESWCFAYDPETKRQSAQWVGENSPRPKKLRFQKSKIKTMLIVLFDSQGIIHKEFVPPGSTVNAEFYKNVLDRLLLDHPPYSPDLSPPDYFLFPKLKMELKGQHFSTIETIQEVVTQKLKNIPTADFSQAMEKLGDRARRCIECNGDYFE